MSEYPLKRDLNISAQHLAEVERILETIDSKMTVWAFGSRVTGNAKQYSDLDLAICAETPITLEKISALREAFDESDLPWKVDIVDYLTVSTDFKKIINRCKVRVQ